MSRGMNSFIFTVALILSATLSARDLTLKQALELGQEHSFELKKARAETEASLSSLKQARSERLPTLSAGATAAYNSFVSSMSLEIPPAMQINQDTRPTFHSACRFTPGGVSAVASARPRPCTTTSRP